MVEGRCFAGNERIAEVAQVGERAVIGALDRLEKEKYIKRIYNENKSRRLEIQCLVAYGKIEAEPVDEKQMTLVDVDAPKKEKGETPGDFARRFFAGDAEAVGGIGKQLEDSGVPREMVIREMLKFKGYWTEPTKNGKKQKWELQQTFDVKRRLGTWFRNIAERQHNNKRAGAGVTV